MNDNFPSIEAKIADLTAKLGLLYDKTDTAQGEADYGAIWNQLQDLYADNTDPVLMWDRMAA